MPEALANYRTGIKVRFTCYVCPRVELETTLGQEERIYPSFQLSGGVGRIRWNPRFHMRTFDIAPYLKCPVCRKIFGSVTICSNGRFKRPTIFGYESEPA